VTSPLADTTNRNYSPVDNVGTTKLNIQELYFFSPECICMFCIVTQT